ncbi:hypothetical protein KUTeg_011740 [Tegillarca granosa]|uniref:Uncharacterized protein n=1 Tax=Tegillarca granosa TaxID=220873 RepID=A0ABQ9EXJ1_TEGGR|nr:hypothetical protein KUTeg_011740 [Tegillarca granosa]
MQVPYKDNDDIRTLVRRAAVLSLLPPDTVKYVWFQAQEDIDDNYINIIIYRVTGQRETVTSGTTMQQGNQGLPTILRAGTGN